MRVEIIASGSKGNCAVIDETLIIDAGWNCTPKGKYVLLTHHHTDHTKHLDNMGGLPIYCTQETADKLRDKFPYTAFNIIEPYQHFTLVDENRRYYITPVRMKHDAPCVGFDISCLHSGSVEDSTRIFFATDFCEFSEARIEENFISELRAKRFDAIYIECNNTLSYKDFIDVYMPDDKPPRDEFHRRKSYENHCNVNYLRDLFTRAGYSEQNRFAEPVTLLHKSSYYYQQDTDKLVELCKIANVVNPLL